MIPLKQSSCAVLAIIAAGLSVSGCDDAKGIPQPGATYSEPARVVPTPVTPKPKPGQVVPKLPYRKHSTDPCAFPGDTLCPRTPLIIPPPRLKW